MSKKVKKSDLGLDREPQAWITVQKSRRKVYTDENNVYLKSGENFEIEIFNPTKIEQLCKIKINGDYISESGLVMNPGQRWFLDRYIESPNKFNFQTYEVENSEESLDAIEDNGKVEIEFYPQLKTFLNGSTGNLWVDKQYIGTPWTVTPEWTPNPIWCTTWNRRIGTGSPISTTTGSLTSNTSYFSSQSNVSYSNTSIETGRIKEGGKSDQKFESSSGSFSFIASRTIEYKIIPESRRKFLKTSDLKSYCTSCGHRIRKDSWSYCPECGGKLDK